MKSYISRKFPLETRTTDQTFVFRSSEKLIRARRSVARPATPVLTVRRSFTSSSFSCFRGLPACLLEDGIGGPWFWCPNRRADSSSKICGKADAGHLDGGPPLANVPPPVPSLLSYQ